MIINEKSKKINYLLAYFTNYLEYFYTLSKFSFQQLTSYEFIRENINYFKIKIITIYF